MPVTEVTEGKTQEELDAESVVVAEAETEVEQEQGETEVEQTEQPEVVVTIGDKEPEVDEDAGKPQFIQLRTAHREAVKEAKELRRRLEAVEGAKTADGLGPKPTLADSNYDEAEHDAKLDAWYTKKGEVAAAKQKETDAKAEADRAWQAKLDGYGKVKTEFKTRAPDFDEAEAEVQGVLSGVQQGIIVKGASNAATLIYALYKHPEKLKELGALQDPVDFAVAIGKLEAQLKVSDRKAPPAPSGGVRGTAAVGTGSDQKLAALRAAAEKSGDYTQVLAYKRSVKQKEKRA